MTQREHDSTQHNTKRLHDTCSRDTRTATGTQHKPTRHPFCSVFQMTTWGGLASFGLGRVPVRDSSLLEEITSDGLASTWIRGRQILTFALVAVDACKQVFNFWWLQWTFQLLQQVKVQRSNQICHGVTDQTNTPCFPKRLGSNQMYGSNQKPKTTPKPNKLENNKKRFNAPEAPGVVHGLLGRPPRHGVSAQEPAAEAASLWRLPQPGALDATKRDPWARNRRGKRNGV